MLKLESLNDARNMRACGCDAWYNPEEHAIYIGFAQSSDILELLSHEALHQTIREMWAFPEHIAIKASRGIDIIIRSYGHILRRGGL